MRLGTKIFFCVIVCFSVIFLAGGYSLISYVYKVTIDREIDMAAEQYQYNKFVIQAAFITRGESWFQRVLSGDYDIGDIAAQLNDTVAILASDGKILYSEFPPDMKFEELLYDRKENEVEYRFRNVGGRDHVILTGKVTQNGAEVYLITGLDIERVTGQQDQIIVKFGWIYGLAIGAGILLVFGLSFLLTKPIKHLITATSKIAEGNYQERIVERRKDEVGQLAANFNHMAEAIEEKMERLVENAREKEDFVANFAHELKTPLTSVIGYANRIYQKELPREEQKKAAWYIWNEGMRLEALSHKLMELTLLNHKSFELQVMRADQLLYEMMQDFAYMAEERGISIHCRAEKALVRVEFDLFKSLLLNLIDNAVKAGAKEIIVSGRVFTAAGKILPESGYVLRIQDNGCGIPENEIKRITEAFYMVDKSRSRKQHGAGIGLALAEKIAQIHGTRLKFESDGRTGTCVILELQCGGN